MQGDVINTIFGDFQRKFKHFFELCERGFTNELIIQMFARIYPPSTKLVTYKKKFNELFFIQEGEILMFNKFQLNSFMKLPQYSYFGDYQVLYDLHSNIVFKTGTEYQLTRFMCIKKKVFLALCELYPTTAENLRIRALERRFEFMKKMHEQD
mmetsp:Transcript_4810/g.4463  ORF Transcript_4810/g.4463 Transcript_4810/m.4463 type:complete len:153 (-) Transcript_4810:304-762(-)